MWEMTDSLLAIYSDDVSLIKIYLQNGEKIQIESTDVKKFIIDDTNPNNFAYYTSDDQVRLLLTRFMFIIIKVKLRNLSVSGKERVGNLFSYRQPKTSKLWFLG